MKYVSVNEMVSIEMEADKTGLTYEIMMENAGNALAEVILEEYSSFPTQGVLGLVGSGNNGGDTLVALSCLAKRGWRTGAYIIRERPQGDPLVNRYLQSGGNILVAKLDSKYERLQKMLKDYGIILDGVLGTGIKLPLKAELAKIFDLIKANLSTEVRKPIVVAVDCPSGVDCDSGEAASECIPADLTVTMAAVKQGLFKFPAYNYVGNLRVVGIGLPGNGESLESWRAIRSFIPEENWVKQNLPPRPLDSHKGTFGTALIVAGCLKYSGASLLAGKAAYRIGAGLVTLAIPSILHAALSGHFIEATWQPLPHSNGFISSQASHVILDNIARVTAVLLGPGFGLEKTTEDFLRGLFEHSSHKNYQGSHNQPTLLPPLVIDADGLKLLSKIQESP